MSGHSKWSTIKRKKAANDAKRGTLFTRLAREIALAAREGGGDAESNFALRLAVERAKAENMPKDNIERAIRRGTGQDKDGAELEQITYEGYAPNGIALMIEVITDNRNRTVANIRHCLSSKGGSLAEAGSVTWQFHRSAYFEFPVAEHDEDTLFDLAVEAGADDVIFDGNVEILAPVEAFKQISDRLKDEGIQPEVSELRWIPNAEIPLTPEDALQVLKVIEHLEDLDDVQHVYSNLELSDAAVSMLETA